MLRPKYDIQIQYARDDCRAALTVGVIESRVTADISERLMDAVASGLNIEGVKVTKPLNKYLRIVWDSYYEMSDIAKEILLIIKYEAEIEGVSFVSTLGGTPQPVNAFEDDLAKMMAAKDSFEFLVRLRVKED